MLVLITRNLQKNFLDLLELQEDVEESRAILEIRVRARTRELRELAESLDRQVKEKTKSLQEKIEELEKFNRLAVGRELKMIELKEEIKKLKEEVEKHKKGQ
jgi:C4-dicarboxylate-specific signal transduction histidine kinase